MDSCYVEISLASLSARERTVVVRNRHQRKKRIRRVVHVVLKSEIPLLYVPGGKKMIRIGEKRHIALAGRLCGKDDALLVAAVPYAVRVSGVGADEVRCSLSVSRQYLALDDIYHPFWTAFPNNPTL